MVGLEERPTESPSPEVCRALADDRRRLALQILERYDEPIALDVLAKEVVAEEQDVPTVAVSDDDVADAKIHLYHATLLKLADAGLVDWERGDERVSISDHDVFERFDSIHY